MATKAQLPQNSPWFLRKERKRQNQRSLPSHDSVVLSVTSVSYFRSFIFLQIHSFLAQLTSQILHILQVFLWPSEMVYSPYLKNNA